MTTKALRHLVEERRDDILRIARSHGAESILLVGSVARGDEQAASDLDFLVRFESGRSLFDQAGLIYELEQLLDVPVDVISEGGLRDSDVAIREDATPL